MYRCTLLYNKIFAYVHVYTYQCIEGNMLNKYNDVKHI